MDNTLDDIKSITEDIAETEPLTTVVGIKSKDGIVIASESLFSGEMTKTVGSKIYKINQYSVMGIAGILSQMNLLVEKLQQRLGDNTFSKDDFEINVEDALLELHNRYNARWSKALDKETVIFKP